MQGAALWHGLPEHVTFTNDGRGRRDPGYSHTQPTYIGGGFFSLLGSQTKKKRGIPIRILKRSVATAHIGLMRTTGKIMLTRQPPIGILQEKLVTPFCLSTTPTRGSPATNRFRFSTKNRAVRGT